MKKSAFFLLVVLLAISCKENKINKNLKIIGFIKGFKKGTLFINKVKDTTFVTLDTIKIDGNSHFESDLNISSPEMYYLTMDRGTTKSIDNSLSFFAEPGTINIESSLEFFTSDAKITGSKNQELYDEYKKVVSRYVDQNLDLIERKFKALKNKNNQELIDISKKQDDLLRKKYLYTTNFAVNHSNFEVSPYVLVSEIYDINLKYLDTIQKSMTPKIAKSLYGKQLQTLIIERRRRENK